MLFPSGEYRHTCTHVALAHSFIIVHACRYWIHAILICNLGKAAQILLCSCLGYCANAPIMRYRHILHHMVFIASYSAYK